MAHHHNAAFDSMKTGHFPALVHAIHALGHWLPAVETASPATDVNGSDALRCVTRERDNEISVVSVAGVIDLETAQDLGSLLNEYISAGRNVILSMSGVTGIDSAGVAVLVQAIAAARNRGLAFSLVAATQEVKAALDLYHLKLLVPEYKHLGGAIKQVLRSLAVHQKQRKCA